MSIVSIHGTIAVVFSWEYNAYERNCQWGF